MNDKHAVYPTITGFNHKPFAVPPTALADIPFAKILSCWETLVKNIHYPSRPLVPFSSLPSPVFWVTLPFEGAVVIALSRASNLKELRQRPFQTGSDIDCHLQVAPCIPEHVRNVLLACQQAHTPQQTEEQQVLATCPLHDSVQD